MKSLYIFMVLCAFICVVGCGRKDEPARITSEDDQVSVTIETKESLRLEHDLKRLSALSVALQKMAKEMGELQKDINRKGLGHFTSDDQDKIENIFFRYLICRESLWDMVDYYREYEKHFTDIEDQTRGFIIGFNAALHLANYSTLVVATFIDDDTVIDKLNEEYYRSGIPAGTYNKLFDGVTTIENIESLKTGWQLYSSEMSDEKSVLYSIARSDPSYSESIAQISGLYADVDKRIEYILKKSSLLLSDVRNRLRNTSIMALAKKTKTAFGNNLDAARGILFVNVSRLKSPTGVNISLSREQLKEIKSRLQPGDIIMTFSAGYMSNIFLPGKFKHGITYVGSPAQRKAVGLPLAAIPDTPVRKIEKMKADLKVAKLPSGKEADLVEAVAEGVIFNSLEEITNHHIARLVVLRPRLSKQEMAHNLTTVFLLMGNAYDFEFDFTDGSCQCCTEVIYRALNKVGPIRFNLKSRMGVQTLCADDIIEYYLDSEDKPFDFVLFAEEDSGSKDHRAKILVGDAGNKRLRKLMNPGKSDSK